MTQLFLSNLPGPTCWRRAHSTNTVWIPAEKKRGGPPPNKQNKTTKTKSVLGFCSRLWLVFVRPQLYDCSHRGMVISYMSVCISPVKWRKTNTRSRLVFLLGKEPLSACCHKWEPCHCEGGDGLGWWRQRGYPAFTKHWDIISKKYVCVQYKLSFFPALPVFFLQAHMPSLRRSYLNSKKEKKLKASLKLLLACRGRQLTIWCFHIHTVKYRTSM